MKNLILALSILAASCGAEKHASTELSAVASPSTTAEPIDCGDRCPTDAEILFFNTKYTGYQPAASGESLGEACSVQFIYLTNCAKGHMACFGVTVNDLGKTPVAMKTGQIKKDYQLYLPVEKGKPGKYSFYSAEYGLYEHTAIEWDEQPQVVKVTSTRHFGWTKAKLNGTVVCQNLTKVRNPY